MKPGQFSERSSAALATCDERLQRLFNDVVAIHDCTVAEGHRGQELQDRYFREGRSHLRWPDGRHNSSPSRAVDVWPYLRGIGVPWAETLMRLGYTRPQADEGCRLAFALFAGVVLATAARQGVGVRHGANWDGDELVAIDQKFDDWPHWELVG